MFSWKANNYLLVVDRMSGYIFVEQLHKSAKCKTVTEKFRLLTLTYGFPREVRYDKGPQFSTEFKESHRMSPLKGLTISSQESQVDFSIVISRCELLSWRAANN